MRTSETINNQEVQAYRSGCSKHHVFLEGQEGVDTANFVRNYFLKTWDEEITEANLDKALPYIRPHLKFKSEALVKLENAAAAHPTALEVSNQTNSDDERRNLACCV